MNLKTKDSYPLPFGPLSHSPVNEQGVVFLFSHFYKKLGFDKITYIQNYFPDCIAIDKKGKTVKIEFEFKSSSIKHHRKEGRNYLDKIDYIICWEDDFQQIPLKHASKVIELKNLFDLGRNIFMSGVDKTWFKEIDKSKKTSWSVKNNARKGDLMLLYRKHPESCIKDIFVLTENADYFESSNKWQKMSGKKKDKFADMKRVGLQLKDPVTYEDFKNHKNLKTASFVRKNFQGRHDITVYWHYIYALIIKKNPYLKTYLLNYLP